MLAPAVKTAAADIWLFRKEPERWLEVARDSDRVLIHPLFLHEPGFNAESYDRVSVIPSVEFAAYHPDLCYAAATEGAVQGPLNAYQSILAIAGYQAGFSVERTLALFNGHMFQACGYCDLWPSEVGRLIGSFQAQQLDISEDIRLWSHGACFMHSFDHPKIACLDTIARTFVRSVGIEPLDPTYLPHDNLLNGASWPVYPEIGDRYGVRGDYLFKAPNDYRQIPLREFIEASFHAYDKLSDIKVLGAQTRARFETAWNIVTRRQ